MKGIFEKIRKWLIKKLGGDYTPFESTIKVNVCHEKPIPLRVNIEVPCEWEFKMGQGEREEWLERHLAEEIAKGLVKNKLYTIISSTNMATDRVTYRGEVLVLRGTGGRYISGVAM